MVGWVGIHFLWISRGTDVTMEEVDSLGELGFVSIVVFDRLLREDTAEYTCTAKNSLPGQQTGYLTDQSPAILLTVLGKYQYYCTVH